MKTRANIKDKHKNKNKKRINKKQKKESFSLINPNAAGIDVGSTSMYVAVPEDRSNQPVRKFGTYTKDLHELAEWLINCGIDTVAMESTGVYWINIYQILERKGIDVKLINARHVKNLPGRKSDVKDCQWLQKLHSYGLLAPSFRPPDDIVILRSFLRQRDKLVKMQATSIQHMQKALIQMNLLLHNVITDITGATGMKIIESILAGERDPNKLSEYRNSRCKKSKEEIALSLEGEYRKEQLFALKLALDTYKHHQNQIYLCDKEIKEHFDTLEEIKKKKNEISKKRVKGKKKIDPQFNVRSYLHCIVGVDLTEIPGLRELSVLGLIAEIGTDMTNWNTSSHFTSWLGVCPDPRISGDKLLGTKTRKVKSRAANILRMAALSVSRTDTPLGHFYQRMKAKLGAAEAITATAHKIARIMYSMIKNKTAYDPKLVERNNIRNDLMRINYLKQKALKLGYEFKKKTA
jgi:transposase